MAQKIRKELFDAIYFDYSDKDWRNPAVSRLVEQAFVERAPDQWSGPELRWALEGAWLASRGDIVAWLRSSYWKHNRKRMVSERDSRNAMAAHPPAASVINTASAASNPAGKAWMDHGEVNTKGAEPTSG